MTKLSQYLNEGIGLQGDTSGLFSYVGKIGKAKSNHFKDYDPSNLKFNYNFDNNKNSDFMFCYNGLGATQTKLLDGSTYPIYYAFYVNQKNPHSSNITPRIVNWLKHNRIYAKTFFTDLTNYMFENRQLKGWRPDIIIMAESESKFNQTWSYCIKQKLGINPLEIVSGKTKDSNTIMPYLRIPEENPAQSSLDRFNDLKNTLSKGNKIDSKGIPSGMRRFIHGGFHLISDQDTDRILKMNLQHYNILIIDDSMSVRAVTFKSILQDLKEKVLDKIKTDIRIITPFRLP